MHNHRDVDDGLRAEQTGRGIVKEFGNLLVHYALVGLITQPGSRVVTKEFLHFVISGALSLLGNGGSIERNKGQRQQRQFFQSGQVLISN